MQQHDEAYQREYDAAIAEMDKREAAPATTSRGDNGRFTAKAEPEPQAEPKADETPPPEPEPVVEPVAEDPLAEIRTKLEKTEKALKDTQAWGTKNAQRLAEIEREREQQQHAALKPQLLQEHPELEQAIKYVATNPQQKAEEVQQARSKEWMAIVEAAHPGIFASDAEPELIDALVTKRDALGDQWYADPMLAIREITAEKLAHTERQVGKRFAAESVKLSQKSAMSVPTPGGGSGVKAPSNPEQEEASRILNMSDADFAREVRKVRGY